VRIGLIIYGSLDTLTGGYLYDRMLVEDLRRRGDEVEIISLPWRSYPHHLSDNLRWALWRRLHRADFDALLQDELNHPSLVWLNGRLRTSVSYPLITIVHLLRSSEPRPVWSNRLYRWVERRYLRGVDGCIYNSQTTQAAVEEVLGSIPLGVVAYPGRDHVPCGLTPDQIVARALQPGPLHILFVGNLTPLKGLHTLLQAAAQLPKDDWRLTVAGSLAMAPEYVATVRQQIARDGLSRQVTLLGVVPNAVVATYLAQSHVLAVPSFYEAFGIVYLEAMSFGLPIIASTAGGARELVTHGQEGFLVPAGDADALAHHLRTLGRDRDCLCRMGVAASERVQSHPTWAESSGRIRDFIQTLRR
jgi:glycosyltransferase involved in cell wall biosynthesis